MFGASNGSMVPSTVTAGKSCDAMKVMRINRAINGLGRIPLASEVPRGHLLEVCEAGEDAWSAFVASENQALRSKHMVWANNKIFIVEFPGEGHEEVAEALVDLVKAIPNIRHYLASHGSRFLDSGPRYEADASFGPKRPFWEPRGMQLPIGIDKWGDYTTLKVEVGVSRGWGMAPGNLDWKATRAWNRVTGVAYVLCIAVDPQLLQASYKKYELPDDPAHRRVMPFIAQATNVVAGGPPVQFDARRLLGLPLGLAVPPQFPDPLTIDLNAVLEGARAEIYLSDFGDEM